MIACGTLSPVTWPEIEAFARALSEFCQVHVSPERVVTVLEAGEITLTHRGIVAELRLVAEGPAGLQNLRDTLGHMLDIGRKGLSEGLRWQAADFAGLPPPNFRRARVLRSTRISPHFQRLRLGARDLGFLSRTGLHLRLLQPRGLPEWPYLSPQGRTVWPKSLHMPVYTLRRLDLAAGWLEVDIFLHGHGPTCAFAQSTQAGDEVGLTGPGGGWLPEARHLVLGGDETALPAIARILESAPPETSGRVILEVGSPEDIQDLARPKGVEVDWLIRGSRDLAAALLERAAAAPAEAHVFFGGEKAQAQALRSLVTQQDARIAAYWTRG